MRPRAVNGYHLGSYFEIDVCAYEQNDSRPAVESSANGGGGVVAVDAEVPDQYEYEVLIYDQSRGRLLVAAIEIVSPANKDRPESRRAFVTKCAALLQERICVSIVDLVTTRHFNLYGDLMELAGDADPDFTALAPATYAVT